MRHLLVIGALVLVPVPAVATTIGFLEPAGNDAPGNTAVTFDGGPRPATCTGTEGPAAPVCTVFPPALDPESVIISFSFPAGSFPTLTGNIRKARAIIVENDQPGAAISDFLILDLTAPTGTSPRPVLDLTFVSDSPEMPLSVLGRTTIPLNFQFAVVENGTSQSIPRSFFFLGSFDDPEAAGVPPELDFVFRSDTEVPEPSSLLLLGSAMLGAMRYMRRRGAGIRHP